MLRLLRQVVFSIPILWVSFVASSNVKAQKIAIISTDTLNYTQRSITGVKSVIRAKIPNITIIDILLSQQESQNSRIADSIHSFKPNLVISIGSDATQFAKDNFKDISIVFSSVMYPVVSGFVESFNRPGGNITGASLSIPTSMQFEYFKSIIPNLKRIGVLYTENTASLIPPSKAVAKEHGMELEAFKVNNEKELPAKLDSLTAVADGVWSLADPNLFTPQSTKYILLNVLKRGKPLMGFSRILVESGALFAIDFDYKAVGRQAGDIALQILGGAKPGNISVTMPDIRWFHYNEKTAQRMAIKIPDSLIAIAKEVYR
jgi:putative ABC transport system substrate-binding protein